MRSAVLDSKGLREIASILRLLGYGLCHQLPERSFFGGGLQAPVCARDTGIYLGFVISLALLIALHKGTRPREFPPLPVWVLLAVLVGFMGWDGVTSYAGLRESNNLLRLITGMSTGFAVAVIVLPLLNDTLWARADNARVLSTLRQILAWLAGLPVGVGLVWVAPALGPVYPVLIAVSILVTLTAVNMVLVGTLPWYDRRAAAWSDLVAPALWGLLLAFLEIAASAAARYWLVGLVG